ncbi:MAG: sigma factor-like helix-turn-helix DNA-binding protein [Candidatus Saccharimonadales bacterium]
MADSKTTKQQLNIEKCVNDILATIDRERERAIISRRFGLFDRKETLEQIGELLGITRERVRQLEKAVIVRLQETGTKLPDVIDLQTQFIKYLDVTGKIARVSDLAAKFTTEGSRIDQSRIAFLAHLCPELYVLEENDDFYHAVSIKTVYDEPKIKKDIAKIIAVIKKIGEPANIDSIAEKAGIKDSKQANSLASVSKQLATLNNRWGLIKWPMVNPKNIRDKIYVILKENGKHMHFNEIAKTIKNSDFKRKNVTTQAIHNELIKDDRFVLIGRGIYALKEWGYSKGTVADIITKVLKDAGQPLHRDEIVKRVLKSRFVKETTILLNLQGKTQFKRVAKATYDIADAPVKAKKAA